MVDVDIYSKDGEYFLYSTRFPTRPMVGDRVKVPNQYIDGKIETVVFAENHLGVVDIEVHLDTEGKKW